MAWTSSRSSGLAVWAWAANNCLRTASAEDATRPAALVVTDGVLVLAAGAGAADVVAAAVAWTTEVAVQEFTPAADPDVPAVVNVALAADAAAGTEVVDAGTEPLGADGLVTAGETAAAGTTAGAVTGAPVTWAVVGAVGDSDVGLLLTVALTGETAGDTEDAAADATLALLLLDGSVARAADRACPMPNLATAPPPSRASLCNRPA